MPKRMYKSDYFARFCPGVYYHVYNRTNSREPLFKDDQDRKFFLSQYKEYLSEYVEICAWCLMENHFHLLVRVKPAELITGYIRHIPEDQRIAAQRNFLESTEGQRNFHTVIERQFTRLFTSYSTKFNTKYNRTGNLFHRPFKRVEVTDNNHLIWLVYYIHSNPFKHGVLKDFTAYKWSSYPTFLSDRHTLMMREEVLEWFGGLNGFLALHHQTSNFSEDTEYLVVEYGTAG